ncbi:MAG: APC family permease [Pseudomonadota bacterium]
MNHSNEIPKTLTERVWHAVLGDPRDPHDPSLMHKMSLAVFLAWVGLGVDGMTSSAYGPEEAFRGLGTHTYLAIFVALATAITVFVISFAYSRLIEHFPHGGGGYVVATQILGKPAGVVSGSALLVDYVFTITVSIASGGDAVFSLLPISWQPYKLIAEYAAVILLVGMNLRGIKESVGIVVPFFLLFLVTHAVLIIGGFVTHIGDVSTVVHQTAQDFRTGVAQVGVWGLFLIFLRGYSMGAGTYTGIEAVSNSVGTLREPKVLTGKRTMALLAFSLAVLAFGLLSLYMLFGVRPEEGRTLNTVLATAFAGQWQIGPFEVGKWFVWATIFSESILLVFAAQTGFIAGPQVMANMAVDLWFPKRFANLSDRFSMQNGVILMGLTAIVALALTRGRIGILVVLYSINVFVTFSLSQAAMAWFWIRSRHDHPTKWRRNLSVHVVGFILCFSILWVMILEKFFHGAWATILVTGALIAACVAIRKHYRTVGKRIAGSTREFREDAEIQTWFDRARTNPLPSFDPLKPTAAILVGGYNQLGIRNLFGILKRFPHTFSNVVFMSVGVIDSEFLKRGHAELVEQRTKENLDKYVDLAARIGLPAKSYVTSGADVVRTASELCLDIGKDLRNVTFFAGELVFGKPKWYEPLLHNQTAYAIQRQLRFSGLPFVILPMVLPEK